MAVLRAGLDEVTAELPPGAEHEVLQRRVP
jgi:hypothetical protein